MTDRKQNGLGAVRPRDVPPLPISCGLIKNIAWRMLLNMDTVTDQEIRVLAASVISYVREVDLIEPRRAAT